MDPTFLSGLIVRIGESWPFEGIYRVAGTHDLLCSERIPDQKAHIGGNLSPSAAI
jgi:hypothetical protein